MITGALGGLFREHTNHYKLSSMGDKWCSKVFSTMLRIDIHGFDITFVKDPITQEKETFYLKLTQSWILGLGKCVTAFQIQQYTIISWPYFQKGNWTLFSTYSVPEHKKLTILCTTTKKVDNIFMLSYLLHCFHFRQQIMKFMFSSISWKLKFKKWTNFVIKWYFNRFIPIVSLLKS